MLFITFGTIAVDLVLQQKIFDRDWVGLVLAFMGCAVVIAITQALICALMKWLLMGVYKPVMKPMWSFWAMRTEAIAVLYWGLGGKVLFDYLRGTPFLPYMTGGSHEGGRRSGTENVPSIVGMAKALELAEAERAMESARLRVLRDQLIGGILESVDGAMLTGPRTQRLDSHASFVIRGVEAEGVLIPLDLAGVAASSGSACTSGSHRPAA